MHDKLKFLQPALGAGMVAGLAPIWAKPAYARNLDISSMREADFDLNISEHPNDAKYRVPEAINVKGPVLARLIFSLRAWA